MGEENPAAAMSRSLLGKDKVARLEDRARVVRQGGDVQRMGVVALVSGIGIAPPAETSGELQRPDDCGMGGADRACSMGASRRAPL